MMTLCTTGDSGGNWTIRREVDKWVLYEGRDEVFATEVIIAQEDAWQLFTKGVSMDNVRARSTIKGNNSFGLKVFEMVSIIG
jgi:hypothetical protein